MQRFFFNVFAGSDSYDDEGSVLDSEEDAHVRMLGIARDLIKYSKAKTWSIEALNEKGRLIGCLDFGMLREPVNAVAQVLP